MIINIKQGLQLIGGGRTLFRKVCTAQQWLKFSATFSQVRQVHWQKPSTILFQNRLPQDSRLLQVDSNVMKCFVNHKFSKKGGRGSGAKSNSKSGQKNISITESDEEVLNAVNVEQMRSEMEAILERLKDDFVIHLKVRTDIGSFNKILVSIEGQDVPLNQVAQIMQKGQMIQINLGASPQYIPPVRRSLETAGLNINPQLEGNSIFLPVPKVTREHREKMAKLAKDLFNKTKEDVNQSHSKYYRQVKKSEKDLGVDLFRDIQSLLTNISHEYRDKAEEMMKKKQKEVLGNS